MYKDDNNHDQYVITIDIDNFLIDWMDVVRLFIWELNNNVKFRKL